MSAEGAVAAAIIAALDDLAGLNGVYAGAPVKASEPYAEIGDVLGVDWSVKDRAGRELRVAVTLRDAGEMSARVAALAGAAGAAIEALPRALDGWDVASVVLARSRLTGPTPGRWAALLDYRVRVLAHAS